jgi:hypothetical protein
MSRVLVTSSLVACVSKEEIAREKKKDQQRINLTPKKGFLMVEFQVLWLGCDFFWE